MIRVKVPATSANLGPGFDSLGLALNLFNTLTIEESDKWQIFLRGKYISGLPVDESNLVWRTMLHLWQKANFPVPKKIALTLDNQIPPARGLGSSSAAIVGGLLLANAFAGKPFSQPELLQIANELEGHPDNVTPALYGGVTLAVEGLEGIIPRILCEKPHVHVLVIVPDFQLKTSKSRNVLSPQVSRHDAIFNLSHTALVVDAIIREEYDLLKEAMRDKLHQEQRAALVPGLPEALRSAVENGAYGAALSGSGPTLLAFLPEERTKSVAQAMLQAFADHGLNAESYSLQVYPRGAHII